MTDRLYFTNSYLFEFDAHVVWRSSDGLRVALDRTAFYPTSGGQPNDIGMLAGCRVIDVIDEDDQIVHGLAEEISPGIQVVHGIVDSTRRLDHMRQHTGQHLLSAVMEEEFGLKTVSFHLGAQYATLDVEPQSVSPSTLHSIEQRANERLLENRRIAISFEDAGGAIGLRKASDRDGIIRVVSIEGLDRSACGGTHVSQTGEIGMIALGKTEKIRKALRIEFYCGPRALSFLKNRIADMEMQSNQARVRLAEVDKQRRKLAEELALIAGQKKYSTTVPDGSGRVLWIESFHAFPEDLASTMNAFLEGHASMAILTSASDGKVLFGAHSGLGLDCGKRLREALTALGGKGGGSPRSAQGSIADPARLEELTRLLLAV